MNVLVAAEKSREAFRTISEVAVELELPQHVLRFWESKFPQLKPLKRGGGRRYYRPDDLDLLRGIRSLLYSEGLTIKGVQKILREQGQRYVMELGRGATTLIPPRALSAVALAKADESERTPEPAAPPTNVHRFSREPAPGPGPEPNPRLSADDRAHFSTLLDELSELKSRLTAARRSPRLSQ